MRKHDPSEMQAHDRKPRVRREEDWGADYWAAERLKIKRAMKAAGMDDRVKIDRFGKITIDLKTGNRR